MSAVGTQNANAKKTAAKIVIVIRMGKKSDRNSVR